MEDLPNNDKLLSAAVARLEALEQERADLLENIKRLRVEPGEGSVPPNVSAAPGASPPVVSARVFPPASVSTTITTILDGTATGSSRPVIQVQAKPKIEYMSYPESCFTAQAVALAKVVEVLPLRRNPLAGTGDPDGPNEHQPIVY